MNLKNVVERLFSENQKSNEDLIRSFGRAEGYFEQMYEGRFIYELLQNARDAICGRGHEAMGNVSAWFEGDVFCFANDGLPFDEAAVRGICYVGMSSKHSTDFIGHKGLGFKSVMEVTDKPEIITLGGTIFFDRHETSKRIQLAPKEIPLFIFPHYRPEPIQELYPALTAKGFTTVMRFPLIEKHLKQVVLDKMREIRPEEVLFLGNIARLKLGDREIRIEDDIEESLGITEVKDDGTPNYFRSFPFDFAIEDFEYSKFTDKERELFANSRSISSLVLLPINQSGEYLRPKESYLYLFYRMKITTGLGFYLHSYFTATPDRKGLLGSSKVNQLIFRKVAEWVATTFVKEIKGLYPSQLLDILQYQRQTEEELLPLYNLLRAELRKVALIPTTESDKFLSAQQVTVLTTDWSKLLEGQLSGLRRLIFPQSNTVRNWLVQEYGCALWSDEKAPAAIESICTRKLDEPAFFQVLYEIVRAKKMDFSGRKVLLTEHCKLVAGKTTQIFYGKKENSIPAILGDQLSSLHPSIELGWIKYKDEYLGIKSYEKENLINVALQVLQKTLSNAANAERKKLAALNFLATLVEEKHVSDIRGRIEVPVLGQVAWANPLKVPVYMPGYRYLSVTTKSKVLDVGRLLSAEGAVSEMMVNRFWQLVNIRTIPATYLTRTLARNLDDQQLSYLKKERPIVSGATIDNDRAIDLPEQFDQNFGSIILSNWAEYHNFISMPGPFPMAHYVSTDREPFKSPENAFKVSHIIGALRKNRWVNVDGKSELQRPIDIVCMQPEEMGLEENRLLIEYLNVVPLDHTTHLLFINDFELFHFKHPQKGRLISLMKWIAATYADASPEILREKKFTTFYNKMLGICFLEYEKLLTSPPQQRLDFVNQLKVIQFLGKPILDNAYRWVLASQLILVDDQKLLEGLDDEIKEQIDNPYLFTKRDRNEFGKLGRVLGRKFSHEVKLSVVSIAENRSSVKEQVPAVALVLALLEDSMGRVFTGEQLHRILHAEVQLHQPLVVRYSLKEQSKDRSEEYYSANSVALYLRDGITANAHSMQFAAAVVGFLETLLDREFRNYDALVSTLFSEIGNGRELEFVLGRGVDLSRIEALNEIVGAEMGRAVGNSSANSSQAAREDSPKTADRLPVDQSVPQTVVSRQVRQHEIKMTLEELLKKFGQIVEADLFKNEFEVAESDAASGKSKGVRTGNPSTGTELTDYTKGLVGMVGEHLIWKALLQGDANLRIALGIPLGDRMEVEWHNQHRLTDYNQKDGSQGKGCDMYISSHRKYIEVKAAVEESPWMYISGPEFQKMKLHGDDYFLIIIKRLMQGNAGRIIKVVRNPYERILDGGLDLVSGTYRDELG